MAEISKVRFGGVDYDIKSITDASLFTANMPADAKVVGREFKIIANLGSSTGADYSPWTSGKTILNTGKIGTSNTNSACSEFIKIPDFATAVTVKCNGYSGVVGMYSDNTEASYIDRVFLGTTGSVVVDLTSAKYIRIAIGSLDISDASTIEIKYSYALKTTLDEMITDIRNAVETIPLVDPTLTQSGQAADAKETWNRIDSAKNEWADKFADVSDALDMSLVEEVNKTNTSSAKNASGATLISSYGFSNGVYFPIEYPIDSEKTYVVAMRYNNGDATRTCRWGFCDKEKVQIGGDNYVNLSSGLLGQPSASGIIVYVTNSTNLNIIQSATIDWIQLVEQSVYLAHSETEYEYIKPAHISERLNEIESSHIYGIKISSDGTVTRTDGAVGLNNDYVIGSTYQNGGHNDFDSCYPWSEIKLCNIYTDNNGDEQIIYSDSSLFSRDGSKGDVFVEIPKFYSVRYEDSDGNQYVKISGTPQQKFLLEPCFYDSVTGKEIEKIYVAAYHSSGNPILRSVSDAIPTTHKPLSFYKSSGEMYDFVTLQAIQKLFSIEFAAIDSSLIFGGYSNLPWSKAIYPYANATNTNSGAFIGDARIKNLKVGSIISINQTFGTIENREITAITAPVASGSRWIRTITFTGSPMDLIIPDDLPSNERQMLYCSAQKTGASDVLDYHTGRTDDDVNDPLLANQFRYRWIEGLWGTIGELFDGAVVKNMHVYWDNLKANYGTPESCRRINFKIPLQNTYATSEHPLPQYVKKMGIDFKSPQIAVPQEMTDDAFYYGDGFFSVDTEGPDGQTYEEGTIFIGCSSMAWDGRYYNGLYCIRFWSPAWSGGSWLYGSRLIRRHFD